MTTADDSPPIVRLERDRREADARYNDALTALDRAIVAVSEQPALTRADFARVATPLILFLQQITAFVETKDRELLAAADEKIGAVARAVEPLAELRQQMRILQRALEALTRQVTARPTGTQPLNDAHHHGEPAPIPAASADHKADHKYVAFEDHFRGSDQSIAARLRGYVPLFAAAGRAPVVDIGCGRGELLAELQASGVVARGVDANAEMAASARAKGLDAVHGDALAFLDTFADASLGGVAAAQVVEHLEPSYLLALLDTAARKLLPGAPIVLETINPACWLAFFSSYIRDFTHVRPVHPETLQYLVRASGFERVEIRYSAPVPDEVKLKTFDLPAPLRSASDPATIAMQGLAHAVNANATILNSLMFTYLDYAVVAYRI